MSQALAFECALSFEALFEKLNELGPWQWRGTESDTYGDYLTTRPVKGVTVRIFDEKTRWILEIDAAPDLAAERDDAERVFRQHIALAIGAHGFYPTKGVY